MPLAKARAMVPRIAGRVGPESFDKLFVAKLVGYGGRVERRIGAGHLLAHLRHCRCDCGFAFFIAKPRRDKFFFYDPAHRRFCLRDFCLL